MSGLMAGVAVPVAAYAAPTETAIVTPPPTTTVSRTWTLDGNEVVSNQEMSCPAGFRLENRDYSPMRVVPRGVEVIGDLVALVGTNLNDAVGNRIGATEIRMRNYSWMRNEVTIILHCELIETPPPTG
ncbi:hypothetical protein [Microbacterium rhizomatis]|uniref:Uncharacterized protein n=1 Tax=Microbacterium rhizomatis TaxID=1631477 RepID=A0A5J5J946_9MICO|nr:hypothetical protein [Microbacterium rhizomatis]KAA9111545.1 hypothetical protein F6B43_08275 [Microbacterium rhizomatis]